MYRRRCRIRVTILGCSGGVAAGLRTTCLMLDDDTLVDTERAQAT